MNHHIEEFVNQYPLLSCCQDDIKKSCHILINTYKMNGKLLICGNGGSASDSEHIVGELMKGFMLPRRINAEDRKKILETAVNDGELICNHLQSSLPAISLVSQTSFMTAFSNDMEPSMLFAQQVYGYAEKNDTVLGISTSGNSSNVIYAMEVARSFGIKTIALTGRTGGKLAEICDVTIKVPSDITPDIQEMHLPVYHVICKIIENNFFGKC